MKKKFQFIYNIYHMESLWDIICYLEDAGKGYANTFKNGLKNDILEALKLMLNQNIIYIGDEWIGKHYLKGWELSNEEIIEKINNKWTEDIKYEDLYVLAWIGYEDWYIKALEKRGLIQTTNWKNFVKDKIGDLEKWIEENKPKEIK